MFNHAQFILALLASNFLHVAASPTTEAALEKRSIDDLLKFGLPPGDDPNKFAKRSTIQRRDFDQDTFHSALPGCGEDPSYALGLSRYNDGEGTMISSGYCDNKKYLFGWHCWTDIFNVKVKIEYDDWTNTGGIIDCATTSLCTLQGINLNQSCTANPESWDNAIQTGVESKLNEIKETLWPVGGKLEYSHNFWGSRTFVTCNTVSDSGTCSWNDKGCHGIWKGKRNKRVFGYLRRSCDKPRDGTNMRNTQRRQDGYFSVGMLDFDIVVPDDQAIGCAASCSDHSYPKPRLPNEEVVPWPGA